MEIQLERTGGFAGITISSKVDTASLSATESQELEQMINQVNFFSLPATFTTGRPGADQFNYKLTVISEGQQHTVEMGDMSMPEIMRPLVQKLTQIAKKR